MKATDLLKAQHREVEALFARLQKHVGAREAEAVVRELATVLGAHMAIEQEIFYPEYAASTDSRDAIRHPFDEHAEAVEQLRQLLAMPGEDPGFGAQVELVRGMIAHHVQEEEQGMFRKAEPIIGDKRLELLAGLMETRFNEAIEHGYQVTTAEGAVDPRDVDRAIWQHTPTGERATPAVLGENRVRKTVAAAARHAAKTASTKPEPKGGGRRHPNSGAAGARKTREGTNNGRPGARGR